jgi:NhaP-type Na+/H+ or K+/H+ antiporter
MHEIVHLATFFAVLVTLSFLVLFKAEGDTKPVIEKNLALFSAFVSGLYVASGSLHYLFVLAVVVAFAVLSRHYQEAKPK